jgi:hypothetical protein
MNDIGGLAPVVSPAKATNMASLLFQSKDGQEPATIQGRSSAAHGETALQVSPAGIERLPGGMGPGIPDTRGGFPESPDSRSKKIIDTIVQNTSFFYERQKFYLINNAPTTNWRALAKVGPNVLDPISQQITGDEDAVGEHLDHLYTNADDRLPKMRRPKCGASRTFGVDPCPHD